MPAPRPPPSADRCSSSRSVAPSRPPRPPSRRSVGRRRPSRPPPRCPVSARRPRRPGPGAGSRDHAAVARALGRRRRAADLGPRRVRGSPVSTARRSSAPTPTVGTSHASRRGRRERARVVGGRRSGAPSRPPVGLARRPAPALDRDADRRQAVQGVRPDRRRSPHDGCHLARRCHARRVVTHPQRPRGSRWSR